VRDELKGELHVWEDGKAILVMTEGELRDDTALFLNDAFLMAEQNALLMVFPFPVEVIRQTGPFHFVGVGKETA
jgi:hypothetical protein